jgi:hypothetical protein
MLSSLILSERMYPRVKPVSLTLTEDHRNVFSPESMPERLELRRNIELVSRLVHQQKPYLEDPIAQNAKE